MYNEPGFESKKGQTLAGIYAKNRSSIEAAKNMYELQRYLSIASKSIKNFLIPYTPRKMLRLDTWLLENRVIQVESWQELLSMEYFRCSFFLWYFWFSDCCYFAQGKKVSYWRRTTRSSCRSLLRRIREIYITMDSKHHTYAAVSAENKKHALRNPGRILIPACMIAIMKGDRSPVK